MNLNQPNLEQNLSISNNFIDEYLFVINKMISFEFYLYERGQYLFVKI